MFRNNSKEFGIAAQFDGEDTASPINPDTPEMREYLHALELMRKGAQDAAQCPPIADAQFSAFMSGIREGIEAHQPRSRGWAVWAPMLSLSAAALLIAVSFLWVLTPTPQQVSATVVESATTDIEGAVINVYDSGYGVTTVWVNTTKGDVW